MKLPKIVGNQIICLFAVFITACSSRDERANNAAATDAPALPPFAETKAKAEGGDAPAQSALGEIYAEGKQVRQDYKQAAEWYRKAAEQGIAKAQFNLGGLYDIGQGVPADEAEAVKWHQKAAEQGHAAAQYTLAGMYGMGRGVPPNPKEALRWYQRGAEQGDELAQFNLAERYERGSNVVQDLSEAYKWHSLAAERGLPDALTARDHLRKRMSSTQLAEARKRIDAFHERFSSKPKN